MKLFHKDRNRVGFSHKEYVAAYSGCVIAYLASYGYVSLSKHVSSPLPDWIFFLGMAVIFWLKSLYHGWMMAKEEE